MEEKGDRALSGSVGVRGGVAFVLAVAGPGGSHEFGSIWEERYRDARRRMEITNVLPCPFWGQALDGFSLGTPAPA